MNGVTGMIDLLSVAYPWLKVGHVLSVISWMAGLFYLPRLFVYHVEGLQKKGVVPGSDMDLLFQHQERLLLKAIMNPAMIASWIFGLALVLTPGIVDWSSAWPWVKAASVIGMTWFHMWLGARRKDFVAGTNRLTGRQYRLMNEVPTVLMVAIVVSVIVRF
jgi:protoporphyrinogen IX oxidase